MATQKRFWVNLEFRISDRQGGGICGSSVNPGFRADVDALTDDLEDRAQEAASEMIKDAFNIARKNAGLQDRLSEAQ